MLLAAAVLFYWYTNGSWLLFALLILAPDLSALGYLAGTTVGAYTYNLFHTYLLPALLVLSGFFTTDTLLLQLGLIWFAHIGGDRLVGYGLKYPTSFQDNHLKRV